MLNELTLQNLGATSGTQVFPGNNSSPREQMYTSQIAQSLTPHGVEERFLQTGAEMDYGTCTFNVEIGEDAIITRMVEKLPATYLTNYRYNPLTTIIWERFDDRGYFDITQVERYNCLHQAFGIIYQPVHKELDKLRPEVGVNAGTVLMRSPAVMDDGGYGTGINANVAFMAISAVDNDGVVVSEELIPALTATGIVSVSGAWGKKKYALNLYGTKDVYKPFPDVGQKIRSDGLLFALREYNEFTAPADMTPQALMEVDYTWDQRFYGKPGGEVLDVTVLHGNIAIPPTPVGMDDQLMGYYNSQQQYWEKIRDTYHELKRKYRDRLRLSESFQNLLVKALAEAPNQPNNVSKTQHKAPLDDWHVKITYSYDVVPSIGSKLSDTHGGKGVIVDIWKKEDMPVDDYGRRAGLIMDPDSTVDRMNIGRMYEHGTNWYSAMVLRDIRLAKESGDPDWWLYAKELLLEYYRAASIMHYEEMVTLITTKESVLWHLDYILKWKDGIHMWMPPHRPDAGAPAYRNIRAGFESRYEQTPVTYRNPQGRVIRTRNNIRIGSLYIILLEKTGEDWSAVSSPKLQHFGIPAMITNEDKYSTPGREQSSKMPGESESRSWASTMGGRITAEMIAAPNSPQGQRQTAWRLLTDDVPSDIDSIVDDIHRNPNNNRGLQICKHLLQCGGISLVRGGE